MTTLPLLSLTPDVELEPLMVSCPTSMSGALVCSFVPLKDEVPDENNLCFVLVDASIVGGGGGAFVVLGT